MANTDRRCCVHTDRVLVLRRNPNGSYFHACEEAGCPYTWSDRDNRYFGPALLKGRQGLRHAVLLSLLTEGMSLDEAHEMLDRYDLRDLLGLVQRAA